MRLFKLMVPVLLAFALVAGMTTATAAQEDPAASPEADVPQGLEQWYARSFGADIYSMVDPTTPEAMPEGWFLLSTNVLRFEDEESASAGVDDLLAQFDAEMAAADGVELEEVELDLDLDYTAMQAQQEDQGITTIAQEVVAQDGVYVYAIIGITLGEDPDSLTEYTIQTMQDAEVSEDEEIFSADGTSEGGLWAKLPTVEGIVDQEPTMTLAEDGQFYPVPEIPELEATPAA